MKAFASIFGGAFLGVAIFGGGTYIATSHWVEQKLSQMEPNTVTMDVSCVQGNHVVKCPKEFKGYGKARFVPANTEGCNTSDRVKFESDDVVALAVTCARAACIVGSIPGAAIGFALADVKHWG